MKKLVFSVLTGFLWLLVSAPGIAAERPLTVVELYTSQGCSSCPPADAYLGELASRPGILALSFHVDYWDYIGWKDPYADPRHSKRQRAFATQFSQRYVYTPQMIVHGAYQVVGSKKPDVEKAIDQVAGLVRVPLKLTRSNGTYTVDIAAAASHKNVRVISVFYDSKHQTAVKRGENAGRKITNYNVVRELSEIAIWNGEAQTITFKKSDAGGDKCAVLLQSSTTGQIIGAARL